MQVVIERLPSDPFLTQLPGLIGGLLLVGACANWGRSLLTHSSVSSENTGRTSRTAGNYKKTSGIVEQITSSSIVVRADEGHPLELRSKKLGWAIRAGDELIVLTKGNGQLLRVFNPKTKQLFQEEVSSRAYKISFASLFIIFASIPLLGSLLIMSAVSWCFLRTAQSVFSHEPYTKHRFFLLGLGGTCMLILSCAIGGSLGSAGGEDLRYCWFGTVLFSWIWIILYFHFETLAERAIDDMILPKPK